MLTPIRQFRRLGLPGGGRSAWPHWLVTVTRTRHQWWRERSRVEGALGPHRAIHSADQARAIVGSGLAHVLAPDDQIADVHFAAALDDLGGRGGLGHVDYDQIAHDTGGQVAPLQDLDDARLVDGGLPFSVRGAAVGSVDDQVFPVEAGLRPVEGEAVAGPDSLAGSHSDEAENP